jgi:hypothetical protein
MKIELKNIKYAAFASEETSCFSASVCIDGVKSGTAENGGKGGATFIEPQSLADKLNAYAKTLPLKVSTITNPDGTPFTYEQDAESLIDDLLADHLEQKQLKRLCATKTLFRIAGQTYAEGEYLVIKAKFTPELKARIIAKHGQGVTILNETMAVK